VNSEQISVKFVQKSSNKNLPLEGKNMDTKILEQMEEIFGEEIALVQHDLAAMEALVNSPVLVTHKLHVSGS
jgi:ABC-type Mn2+/Zn2+ transport system ATPase subunit